MKCKLLPLDVAGRDPVGIGIALRGRRFSDGKWPKTNGELIDRSVLRVYQLAISRRNGCEMRRELLGAPNARLDALGEKIDSLRKSVDARSRRSATS